MTKFVVGLILAVGAVSVAVTYALPMLGQSNWFVALLAAAATVIAVGLVMASRSCVSPKMFNLGCAAAALALTIFGFGVVTSLVVDGKVVSYNSQQAAVSRQIDELDTSKETLLSAHGLMSATPAEQFARAGESAKMSDTCTALLRQWDRTPPASAQLVDAVVAMKDGASACAQGTKVSSQSSATPDEQTTAAIAAADAKVSAAVTKVEGSIAAAAATEHLVAVPR